MIKTEDFLYEVKALKKANVEHTTVGYAKKTLGREKSYARAMGPRGPPRIPIDRPMETVGTQAQRPGIRPPQIVAQSSEGAAKPALV